MDNATIGTLMILGFLAMCAAYAVAWRWLSGRFGYAMDGKYHIILFIFFAPFVIAIIGGIYIITLIKARSNGSQGGADEIDI